MCCDICSDKVVLVVMLLFTQLTCGFGPVSVTSRAGKNPYQCNPVQVTAAGGDDHHSASGTGQQPEPLRKVTKGSKLLARQPQSHLHLPVVLRVVASECSECEEVLLGICKLHQARYGAKRCITKSQEFGPVVHGVLS